MEDESDITASQENLAKSGPVIAWFVVSILLDGICILFGETGYNMHLCIGLAAVGGYAFGRAHEKLNVE